MNDIVKRLRDSVTQCRAVDRSQLLAEAADEIERLRGRWIPVGERLPENGDTVWGFDPNGVGLCEYHGVHEGFQSYGASCDIEGLNSESLTGITHWMELRIPEPPEVK